MSSPLRIASINSEVIQKKSKAKELADMLTEKWNKQREQRIKKLIQKSKSKSY